MVLRLEVFFRGPDGSVHHIWETSSGGSWARWQSIQLRFKTQGTPSVVANADGRLEVFARGVNNDLVHAWQTSPGGAWSAFASLGGQCDGDPLATRNASGLLEVFVPIQNPEEVDVGHIWQTSANTWSAWATLIYTTPGSAGGTTAGELDLQPPFSVAIGSDGFLILFATSTFYNRPPTATFTGTRTVWRRQDPKSPGGWTPWILDAPPLGGNPIPLRTADGRLCVVARLDDSRMTLLVPPPGGGDTSWVTGPPPFDGGFTTGFSAALDASGWIEVLAFDGNGALWQAAQTGTPPGSSWTHWRMLGGAFAGRPAIAVGAGGKMVAFATGLDGNVWMRPQTAPGIW